MPPFRHHAERPRRMDGGSLRGQAGWGAENQEQHRLLGPRCQGKDPQNGQEEGGGYRC